jgi:hypothetical protein
LLLQPLSALAAYAAQSERRHGDSVDYCLWLLLYDDYIPALGWVCLSILGRFAGTALDQIGITCFSVTGIVLAVVSPVSLLK